jgi:hypothetical protein
MNNYNYNNLTLLQLKILKSKEKDKSKKQNIIKAINKIVKNSQLKWSPNNLLINNKDNESDISDITITITTDISDTSDSKEANKQFNAFTNYDITKYYNKISNKKDDNDKLFNRMMNFADCVKTKKPKDITFIHKPYKENKRLNKKKLGKRKYIN